MAKICQVNHFIRSQKLKSSSQGLEQHDSELPQTIDSGDDCPEKRGHCERWRKLFEERPCLVREGEKIE